MSNELIQNSDYLQWLGNIKQQIRTSQQKASLAVNQELLGLYWFIGKSLATKHTEWGDKFIENLARDLKIEFPDMKGFSKRNLENMKRWYVYYSDHIEIMQQLVAQLRIDTNLEFTQQPVTHLKSYTASEDLDHKVSIILFQIPWGHHTLILTKINGIDEAIFYISKTIQNGWSRSVMQYQIESGLYHRQGKSLTNFQLTLPDSRADLAQEVIKNPYNFDFLMLAEDVKEREFEKALIQHMKKFLLELGRGFAYVGNQYNLNVDGDDFFLDLLFFNISLNCYVIFELKVGDFKPEFAGKLNMYVNAINHQVKQKEHNETIGVLLCKTPNKTVIEYSIKSIQNPLGVSDYSFQTALPNELQAGLPTIKELEEEMDAEIGVQLSPLEEKKNRLLDLINSKAHEEVQLKRTPEVIRTIVDSVFIPLCDWVEQKIEEQQIGSLYFKFQKTYGLEGFGKVDRTEFYVDLDKRGIPQNIQFHCIFDGFKKAGTHAFQSVLSFQFTFSDFKYAITLNYDEKPHQEYLYTNLLNEKILEQLAEKLVSDLLDTVFEAVNRISS